MHASRFQGNNIKIRFFSLFISWLLVLVIFASNPVFADDPTVVQILPSSLSVEPGETFWVNVSCTPGRPIKAYELKLGFDATKLSANSVVEGTIFNGYTTFFNEGTINNTVGTIVDVYGLILGTGSVSLPGSFVAISFTAKYTSGSSVLNLYDVGVANATSYVPIVVYDGNVTLEQYTLTVNVVGSGSVSKNPDLGSYPYGTVVTLTAVPGSGWMFSGWSGDLSGSTNPTTITMNADKTVTATFSQYQYTLSTSVVGSGSISRNPDQPSYGAGTVVTVTANAGVGWLFDHWGGDLSGSTNPTTILMNGNKSVVAYFVDAALPRILSLSLLSSTPIDTDPAFGWVNISCQVTDNVAVDSVKVDITGPGGSPQVNVSMTPGGGGGWYYYNSSSVFGVAGNFSYFVWAEDSAGNENTSDMMVWSLPANWDVDMDGVGSLVDLVYISNHYGETGAAGWVREDVDNNGVIQLLDMVLVSNWYGLSWYS